jgi:hypothetical protein
MPKRPNILKSLMESQTGVPNLDEQQAVIGYLNTRNDKVRKVAIESEEKLFFIKRNGDFVLFANSKSGDTRFSVYNLRLERFVWHYTSEVSPMDISSTGVLLKANYVNYVADIPTAFTAKFIAHGQVVGQFTQEINALFPGVDSSTDVVDFTYRFMGDKFLFIAHSDRSDLMFVQLRDYTGAIVAERLVEKKNIFNQPILDELGFDSMLVHEQMAVLFSHACEPDGSISLVSIDAKKNEIKPMAISCNEKYYYLAGAQTKDSLILAAAKVDEKKGDPLIGHNSLYVYDTCNNQLAASYPLGDNIHSVARVEASDDYIVALCLVAPENDNVNEYTLAINSVNRKTGELSCLGTLPWYGFPDVFYHCENSVSLDLDEHLLHVSYPVNAVPRLNIYEPCDTAIKTTFDLQKAHQLSKRSIPSEGGISSFAGGFFKADWHSPATQFDYETYAAAAPN